MKLNKYHNDIFKLFSGGFLSQILGVLTIPVITRLYTPELYGQYNITIQIIMGASILISFRYEQLLIIFSNYQESIQVLQNILSLGLVMSTLLMLLGYIYNDELLVMSPSLINTYVIFSVILSGFLSSLAYGVEQSLQKRGQFFRSSTGDIVFRVVFFISCILFSFSSLIEYGLIVSYLIAMASKSCHLILLTDFNLFSMPFVRMCDNLKRINKRAFGLVYSHFLLMFSQLVPLNFVNENYGANSLGQFALVLSTLNILILLFSQPMSKVYFQRFVTLHTVNDKISHWNNTFKMSIIIGVPVYFTVYLSSGWGYVFLFGSEWGQAGDIAKIMLFSSFFTFVSRPMESTSISLNFWWYSPLWHTLRVGSIVFLFNYLSHVDNDLNSALIYYVYLSIVIYLIDIFTQRLLIKIKS